MDGWGIARPGEEGRSAILAAHTPFYDSILQKYPHSKLQASGLAVGLPDGQMGNSEVGHTNLGAGRVVYQDLVKINLAVEDGSLAKEPVLASALDYAKTFAKKVHFIGLVSDGGVHSHIDHLKGLCSIRASGWFNRCVCACLHRWTRLRSQKRPWFSEGIGNAHGHHHGSDRQCYGALLCHGPR